MRTQPAKPCLLCGTTGGTIQAGRLLPRRINGLCNSCLKIDRRPGRRTMSTARQPGDPTPWEIAVAVLAIRWEAKGQSRHRFALAECPRPVTVQACPKVQMDPFYHCS